MKKLNNYITERLKLSSKSNTYTCAPDNTSELMTILKERLDKNKNADLNDIDVSKITDMRHLFKDLNPHDIKINEWDVSNVTDMDFMFFGCMHFDCDLSNWDVSNVEDMKFMFTRCEHFKGKGLENWDVSNVTYMHSMFYKCDNFDCNLDNWDTYNVKDMALMFHHCYSLKNKPCWYKEQI